METTEMSIFTKSGLSFAETNLFDKLLIDYVNDVELLKQYYEYEDSIDGVRARIESYKNKRLNRNVLQKALHNQYASVGEIPQSVSANINSLSSEKTFTISTGHQLNLFSGPLYVFYKLVTAISLSEKLKQLIPGYHFVPVYWMAAEDHDMEEISVLSLFGNNIKWESEWKGMSGNAPIKSLEKIIEQVESLFGNSIYASTLKELIHDAYSGSNNLGEATRKWINSLFGNYGLVIVDGNDSELKTLFADIMQDDIVNESAYKIINESTADLKKNYHLQVNPREINLFYTGNDFRSRIVSEDGRYKVLDSDQNFSREQLIAAIKNTPERFSPNVVLRPLYQETILPNVIYTGGPAEIAYWLELRAVFKHYDVPMPALFMRSSAMIVDENTSQLMKKYAITNADLFKSTDELIRKHIVDADGVSLKAVIDSVNAQMDKLSAEAVALDQTLKATIESEKERMLNSLQNLEQKIIRAAKKKNENDVNRIRKIKDRLFPENKHQERHASSLSYLIQWGPEFIGMLLKNLDPLEKKFIILKEESA
jgi:bacillithiol biosynthesis cysteine-adding enzyme BshC